MTTHYFIPISNPHITRWRLIHISYDAFLLVELILMHRTMMATQYFIFSSLIGLIGRFIYKPAVFSLIVALMSMHRTIMATQYFIPTSRFPIARLIYNLSSPP